MAQVPSSFLFFGELRALCGLDMSSMASVEGEARDEMQSFQNPVGGVSIPAFVPSSSSGVGAEEVIKQWKAEQASLARRKQELSKQIRNETRKRSRLREKARKLSNDDLLHVLYSRQQASHVKSIGKASKKK